MSAAAQRTRCQLYMGQTQLKLLDWLRPLVENIDDSRRPLLAACEPVNARVRHRDFKGLFIPNKAMAWPAVPLCELRLFYPDGRLHAVADADSTRWAAWCESQGNARAPNWLPADAPSSSSTYNLDRTERPLLLQGRDRIRGLRRGLQGAELDEQRISRGLSTFEYYDGATLRWWRLELDGQAR